MESKAWNRARLRMAIHVIGLTLAMVLLAVLAWYFG